MFFLFSFSIHLVYSVCQEGDGSNYWKEKTGAPVLCSAECGKGCKNPRVNLSHFFTTFCEMQTWIKLDNIPTYDDYSCEADIEFTEYCRFFWQEHEVKMFTVPGHSAGGTCILFDEKMLFSGDSLIKRHPISCVLPGGSRKKWISQSVPKLIHLKPDTVVYPGHLDSCLLSECELQ